MKLEALRGGWNERRVLGVVIALGCALLVEGVRRSRRIRRREGCRDGWGFFAVALLRALGPPVPSGAIYMLAGLAVLAALAAAVVFNRRRAEIEPEASVLLATAFILLVSPHYAWYFAWVLPLLTRVIYLPLSYVTLASFALYLDEIIGTDAYLHAGLVFYGGVVFLAVIDLMTRFKQTQIRSPA